MYKHILNFKEIIIIIIDFFVDNLSDICILYNVKQMETEIFYENKTVNNLKSTGKCTQINR